MTYIIIPKERGVEEVKDFCIRFNLNGFMTNENGDYIVKCKIIKKEDITEDDGVVRIINGDTLEIYGEDETNE